MNTDKPLERIFNYKGVIPFKCCPENTFSFYQKSEMIEEEIIEGGYLYKAIGIERDGYVIILKQEVIALEAKD